MSVYIIVGCNIIQEMEWRLKKLFEECENKTSEYTIVLSGTPLEVDFMAEQIENKLPALFIREIQSENTIDNIVNSFKLIGNKKYSEYNIVSSEYHINRIKFICLLLNCTKNLNINYHSACTENKIILEKRNQTERLIYKSKHLYKKKILSNNCVRT